MYMYTCTHDTYIYMCVCVCIHTHTSIHTKVCISIQGQHLVAQSSKELQFSTFSEFWIPNIPILHR